MAYINDVLVKINNYISPLIATNLTLDRNGWAVGVTDRLDRSKIYTFENPCAFGAIYGDPDQFGDMASFNFNTKYQQSVAMGDTTPTNGDIVVYLYCKTKNFILFHDGERYIGYGSETDNNPTGNVESLRGLRINGEDIEISTLTAQKFSELIYNKPVILSVRNVPFNQKKWIFSGYGDRSFDYIGELGDAIITWMPATDDEIKLGEGWIAETYGVQNLLPNNHPYRGGVELEPNAAVSKREELVYKVHRFSVDWRPQIELDGVAVTVTDNQVENTGERIVQMRGDDANLNPQVHFYSALTNIEGEEELANLVYSERFFQMEDDVKSIKEQFNKFETDYPLQIQKINDTSVAMQAQITDSLDEYNANVNANFEKLSAQLAEFQLNLNADLTAFKEEVRNDIANFKIEVNNDIKIYKQEVIDNVTAMHTDIKNTVDDIKTLKTLIYAGV